MQPAVAITQLKKRFGRNTAAALDGVDLEIAPGEMVALIGASGSGKSTLMRHIAGLAVGNRNDGPCCVDVLGRRMQADGRLSRDARAIRAQVGFVFQQFNLVGRLPVITNVLTGALARTSSWRSLTGRFLKEDRMLAMQALERVGIARCAYQRASTLSGGEQQRAAIARTLVQRAEIILADEPIASLDPESAHRVMRILAAINREDRKTVVVCLHQVDFALRYCARVVALKHGRIAFDGPSAAVTRGFLRELYGTEMEDLGGLDSLEEGIPNHAVGLRLKAVGADG
ncbi:MAG: phosphonate ABC transporter ATP-binding protein [Alphaproteobacteria bacterium]